MNDLHKQGKETDGAYDTQKKQIIITMKRNFKTVKLLVYFTVFTNVTYMRQHHNNKKSKVVKNGFSLSEGRILKNPVLLFLTIHVFDK